MKCNYCGQDFDFVSALVREPGRADLLNVYGGIVGRLESTRDECVAKCIACIDPAEAERAAERARR